MASPLTLKAPTMEALRTLATETYGPRARVVSADKVTKPGIAGLFGESYFEGIIEVAPAPVSPVPPAHGFADLTGVAALLAQAEAGDDELNAGRLPEVSTRREDFGELMRTLNAEIVDVVAAPPVVLSAAGDLVLVAGTGDTALAPAKAMAELTGAALYTSGLIEAPGIPATEGPHQVMEARASGVLTAKPVVIAFGLGNPGWAGASATSAALLKPDQAWLAVDARLKPADTAAWVMAAGRRLPVSALAVTGADDTSSPSTVNTLGIPVGWTDKGPSSSTTLTDP